MTKHRLSRGHPLTASHFAVQVAMVAVGAEASR